MEAFEAAPVTCPLAVSDSGLTGLDQSGPGSPGDPAERPNGPEEQSHLFAADTLIEGYSRSGLEAEFAVLFSKPDGAASQEGSLCPFPQESEGDGQ